MKLRNQVAFAWGTQTFIPLLECGIHDWKTKQLREGHFQSQYFACQLKKISQILPTLSLI